MLLQQLLGSINKSIFAKEHWDKKPLHISRNDSEYYQGILHIKQVSEYINRKDLHNSYLKMFKGGVEIDQLEYFSNLRVDGFNHEKLIHQPSLKSQRDEGAVLELNMLEKIFPSVGIWKSSLENELQFQVNLAASIFPEKMSEHPCVSDHNSFLLQIHGTTIIEIISHGLENISGNVVESPVNEQNQVKLVMGDLLFLPQGAKYKICSGHHDSVSLHAALIAPTWYDLINDLLDNVNEKHLQFRETIMPHLINVDYDKKLSEIKDLAYTSANFKDQFNSLKQKFSPVEIADNRGKLLDYLALPSITHATIVGRRRINNFCLEKTKDNIKVSFNGKVLQFDHRLENAIIKIAENEKLSVADICDIKDSAHLDFVRQLIKTGFLKIYHE